VSQQFNGQGIREGIDVSALFTALDNAVKVVKNKLAEIKGKSDQFSIGDMFEMQMLTNKLSQLSELSTSVVSACNNAVLSMTRNIKS